MIKLKIWNEVFLDCPGGPNIFTKVSLRGRRSVSSTIVMSCDEILYIT